MGDAGWRSLDPIWSSTRPLAMAEVVLVVGVAVGDDCGRDDEQRKE